MVRDSGIGKAAGQRSGDENAKWKCKMQKASHKVMGQPLRFCGTRLQPGNKVIIEKKKFF